jgi:hypothetical protein
LFSLSDLQELGYTMYYFFFFWTILLAIFLTFLLIISLNLLVKKAKEIYKIKKNYENL